MSLLLRDGRVVLWTRDLEWIRVFYFWQRDDAQLFTAIGATSSFTRRFIKDTACADLSFLNLHFIRNIRVDAGSSSLIS